MTDRERAEQAIAERPFEVQLDDLDTKWLIDRFEHALDAADEMRAAKDAEIARLREALKWIGDPKLHPMHGDPHSLIAAARAALEGKPWLIPG